MTYNGFIRQQLETDVFDLRSLAPASGVPFVDRVVSVVPTPLSKGENSSGNETINKHGFVNFAQKVNPIIENVLKLRI